VKELDLAKKFVDELTSSLKKSGDLGAAESLQILKKYAQSGLYLPLFANFNLLELPMKNQIMKREPELLFPKRFDDLIISESEKANIPKELTFSIIRQESAFNPEARSPADAFGLMQVLPTVAHQIAKKNSLSYVSHNDLFAPELNIAVGTQLLTGLLKKHNNNYIIAIASYNAAEDAVRGWVRSRYTGNTLEFIEDVPYEETKAYIKLVLRNMVFYQRLLEPNKPHTLNETWFTLKL
jgi:soluble lytic murein transglycosylase